MWTATPCRSSTPRAWTPWWTGSSWPPELAAEARGVSDDPDNPMLSSFEANMLKGFARAHPTVTEKFHPHLLG